MKSIKRSLWLNLLTPLDPQTVSQNLITTPFLHRERIAAHISLLVCNARANKELAV